MTPAEREAARELCEKDEGDFTAGCEYCQVLFAEARAALDGQGDPLTSEERARLDDVRMKLGRAWYASDVGKQHMISDLSWARVTLDKYLPPPKETR